MGVVLQRAMAVSMLVLASMVLLWVNMVRSQTGGWMDGQTD
jgi:hypothetical protein